MVGGGSSGARDHAAIGSSQCDATGEDHTDNSDPDRALVRQILGPVSQNDKQRLVLKLKVARTRKRRAGVLRRPQALRVVSDAETETLADARTTPRGPPHRPCSQLRRRGGDDPHYRTCRRRRLLIAGCLRLSLIPKGGQGTQTQPVEDVCPVECAVKAHFDRRF